MRRLGDADVVGIGERLGVEADQFGARASHHRAEGVVRRDDAVLEVGEDHRCHVVLEGQAEVLFGLDDGPVRPRAGRCCRGSSRPSSGDRRSVSGDSAKSTDRTVPSLQQHLEVAVVPDESGVRVPGVLAAGLALQRAQVRRNQDLDVLAHQFLALVAGEVREFGVHVVHDAVRVEQRGAVGERLEQTLPRDRGRRGRTHFSSTTVEHRTRHHALSESWHRT